MDLSKKLISQKNNFENYFRLSKKGTEEAASIISDSISYWLNDSTIITKPNENLTIH